MIKEREADIRNRSIFMMFVLLSKLKVGDGRNLQASITYDHILYLALDEEDDAL